ncbi:MAG TPA: hypothetical protein VGL56_05515 [Fimbriimonadaceae bacterium]|jgi:photosystem II stability/assembly factor-like uncharacterized protein
MKALQALIWPMMALTAISQAQEKGPRQIKDSDLKGLAWRSIGPANMGGRVADICFVPGSFKSFYVAYGIGGVWKTNNLGTTFSPIFDHEVTNSVGSVVAADAPTTWPGWDKGTKPAGREKQGKGKIVWVGTGEGNGRNSSSWGHGVYRSTDGGSSFKNMGLEDSEDIPRLAVDPRNPDVCYVAAMGHLWGPNKMRGVYKTVNGGKTWTPSLQIDENTGAIDVILDPKNPDTVYAAMYARRRTAYSFISGGKQGGIYKSTNAGRSWTKLTNGLPKTSGRIGLDIYAKNPKELFALVESDEGGSYNLDDDRSRSGGLFHSSDAGVTWTKLHSRVPRAFYFAKVRVDPEDDQRVYILGYSVDVSDDGGHTFRKGLTDKTHGDVHALVIDPKDHEHLLLGDDGGLFQSHDKGDTWEFMDNMAVGEFYDLAVDNSTPYNIMGGLQDNGTWVGPSSSITDFWTAGGPGVGITNSSWRMVTDSDGFHCAFDPTDSSIVYSEGQGADLDRTNLATGAHHHLTPIPKEGQPGYRFNWNSPFLYSVHEPQTLYLGGNYVFKLTKRGDDWEKISPDLTKHEIEKDVTTGSNAETYGTVVALNESPLEQGMLWAGSDDGLIHVTTDDGATWNDVTPKAVAGHYVAKLKASCHDKNRAFAAIDMHRDDNMDPLLLMTTNLGKSWTDITGDLPKGWSTKAVWEDLKNPNVLYCGTQNGLYFTYSLAHPHWIKINGGSLPTVPVEDILQHPKTMDLIAATHGRSIFVLDDSTPYSQTTQKVVDSQLFLFHPQPARPAFHLGSGQVLADRQFRAANASQGARINYWVKDYTGDDVSILIEDSKGHKVRSLSGPGKPGYNRVLWDLQPDDNMRINGNLEEPGDPIFVAPGDYKVTISMGKEKMSDTIHVDEIR